MFAFVSRALLLIMFPSCLNLLLLDSEETVRFILSYIVLSLCKILGALFHCIKVVILQ